MNMHNCVLYSRLATSITDRHLIM